MIYPSPMQGNTKKCETMMATEDLDYFDNSCSSLVNSIEYRELFEST